MKTNKKLFRNGVILGVTVLMLCAWSVPAALAQCPAGTVEVFPGSDTCILDPGTINKYEIPLVIPPVMNQAPIIEDDNGEIDNYDIAVRATDPAGWAMEHSVGNHNTDLPGDHRLELWP